jgi:hypothetical protein
VQRFVFSLERVLQHKERRERLAEMRRMRAGAVLQAREAAANLARGRFHEAGAVLARRQALDVTSRLAGFRHLDRLAREVAQAEIHVREAARTLEDASAEHRRLAREAEALRQLRQRRHEEHLKQTLKAEERFLDEQGLRRWFYAEDMEEKGMP